MWKVLSTSSQPLGHGSSVNQELPGGIWLNLQAGRTPEFKAIILMFPRDWSMLSLLPQWLARWFYLTLRGLQTESWERWLTSLYFWNGSPRLFPVLPGPGSQARQWRRHSDFPVSWGWLTPKAFPSLHESLEIILSFSKYLLSECLFCVSIDCSGETVVKDRPTALHSQAL